MRMEGYKQVPQGPAGRPNEYQKLIHVALHDAIHFLAIMTRRVFLPGSVYGCFLHQALHVCVLLIYTISA
jgi:hypothetical protein